MAGPSVVPFAEVTERRGAWMSVTLLERILDKSTLSDLLDTEIAGPLKNILIRNSDAEIAKIEDAWNKGDPAFASRSFPALIGDLVVFDHIFIDRKAAESSFIRMDKVAEVFGPLAEIFCFVDPPAEVYREAIDNTHQLCRNLPEAMHYGYLEKHLRSGENLSEFWDGSLKSLFDSMARQEQEPGAEELPILYADTAAALSACSFICRSSNRAELLFA